MSKNVVKIQKEVSNLKMIVHNLQMQKDEEWLDSADVIQKFHFSESKLYRMRKNKTIPCTKVAGRYLYPKSHFNEVLLEKVKSNLK